MMKSKVIVFIIGIFALGSFNTLARGFHVSKSGNDDANDLAKYSFYTISTAYRDHCTGVMHLNGKLFFGIDLREKVFDPLPLENTQDRKGLLFQWNRKNNRKTTTMWSDFHRFNPKKELVEINVKPLEYLTIQSYPLRMREQITPDPDSQLKNMKRNYREWLSRRPAADLLVEYDPCPVALDTPKPRFTWIMDLEGKGRRQTAYQILVASSRKILDTDEGDMWNTGMVVSDQSSQVIYGGLPLESNMEYCWKVRIRDEAGKIHPYSKTGIFSTGLFSKDDWTADWIGRGDADEVLSDVDAFVTGKISEEVQNITPEARSPLFRHEFRVEKKVHRARLFIAGLGLYELRLNGKKVGDHVLVPSRTDFRKRILYDTYDITSELNLGVNALGIMLGNGWFNGQKKYWGWQMQWYGSPRVILQLDIEYTDGSKSRVVTNSSWKSSWGPITFNCLFDGEHYDARLEQEGWDKPGFDDRDWSPANVVPSPGGKLSSSMHEPELVTQIIKPISVNEPRPDTFVFDLGQNIAGWVRLTVQGHAGTEVILRFAEQIHPDGMIDPSSSRAALQEDHYILKGRGTEVFEPRFTYHGFRYVEVTGYPGTPGLETIEGRFVHTAVAPAGSFTCSNDLINRIHMCMVQSQRCNIQMGVPTDDTQRPERQGWGADALMSAQEAMLNMNMARVYTKWFRDYRDQQDARGRIGFIVPRAGIKEDMVWSSSFVIMPWYQYIYYGDTAVLEENYDAILRYMNYLAGQGLSDIKPIKKGESNPFFGEEILEPHLIGYLQQSQWGDHLSLAEGYHSRSGLPLSISTAFYYHDVQIMEKIASVLGKKEHAAKFHFLAGKIRNAFNNKFLNKEDGYYDDRSQAAQTWPLFFGMVPKEFEKSVMNTLIKDIVEIHNGHPTTGYMGTKYLVDLLTEKGREDLVWNMVLKTDFPSWGYFLRDGRTTIPEKWTGGGSQNHVVLGAAIDPWFYNVLAGINPDERFPGFKKFIIKPFIPDNDLDWVTATVHTIHGTISSSWKKKPGGLILEVKVPANTTATVHLPMSSGAVITESGKPVSQAKGIKFLASEDDEFVFEVQSGSYSFSISGILQRK
ncbi:MAG: family 78 glycoside hydrolase catalytic domain [Bacteroidales bacterium]|nr:family 78 glycoside hydrolase catalytic domain [Bacteroidales bacterium]